MDKQILNKYLGKSYFKKDRRRQELLNDFIDLRQWESNINFVTSGIDRNAVFIDENEQAIINAASPIFGKIVEHMKTPIDYPQALNFRDMFWYIAAYPDVIDFFYPVVENYPYDEKTIKNETRKINESRQTKNQLIRKFEDQAFPNLKQNIEPNPIEYFIVLKDFYKSKKKILLSKK